MFQPDQYAIRRTDRPLSVRFTVAEYTKIKEMSDSSHNSFNRFVLACCTYSLENIRNEDHSPKNTSSTPPNNPFIPLNNIHKTEHKQVTIRFTDELYTRINTLADQSEMTMNQFVLACCRYALEKITIKN